MRQINRLVIHCAATPRNWRAGQSVEQKRDEIARWHTSRGWRAIGYHHVMDRDGAIAEGRPLSEQGAHVAGHNADSIGVCLIGGQDSQATDRFADNFTPAQNDALRAYVADMRRRFPGLEVLGHNELAAKACPGFDVQEWLEEWGAHNVVAQPDPAEQPQGIIAALVAALARIFGGKA